MNDKLNIVNKKLSDFSIYNNGTWQSEKEIITTYSPELGKGLSNTGPARRSLLIPDWYSSKYLTLIRKFLGPSPSAFSGKKSRIITGDVTVWTWDVKVICADRVPVVLYYGAN